MAESVTYAGREITLDALIDARTAVEEMARAHKESTFSNAVHFAGCSTTESAVRDLCTLASAMWYKLKTEQNG